MTTARHAHPRGRFAALLAIAALALGACGGSDDGAGNPDSELTLDEATRELTADAPPELAELRSQANQLLDGGAGAFEERLAELEGHPVVVNKWASWCGPCRLEFPFFQRQASERGGEVAFIGIDSDDSASAARDFLAQLPLPYPSYSDPDQRIAKLIDAPVNFPSTAYYDRSGELVFTHPGGYFSEEDLIADIERWAK